MNTIHLPNQKEKKNTVNKRYAIRLPNALAAKIEALSDLYPLKTYGELMADVLSLGFKKIEEENKSLSGVPLPACSESSQPVYLLHGPFAEFHGLVRKHHLALEQELPDNGNQHDVKKDTYLLDNFD